MGTNASLNTKDSQYELKSVKLDSIRLTTLPEAEAPLFFDQDRFLLRDALALSPETIKLLLRRIPLVVTPSGKLLFQVLFGSRLFNLASQVLEPKEKIAVEVLRNADKAAIDHLRYLDLAVLPLVMSLNVTFLEAHLLVGSSPSSRDLAWRASSKDAFAKAIGASRIRNR